MFSVLSFSGYLLNANNESGINASLNGIGWDSFSKGDLYQILRLLILFQNIGLTKINCKVLLFIILLGESLPNILY